MMRFSADSAMLKRLAPARLDDLWEAEPSSIILPELSHELTQRLFEWAEDSDIDELLEDETRLKALVVEVADVAFQLGFNAQQLNPPGILVGSCLGCNTPYDCGGCQHQGDTRIRINMSRQLSPENNTIVSQNLHRAVNLFALTANLLSKRNSYKLAALMTPEAPHKTSISDYVHGLALSGTRGFCCVLQLFALLDNASKAFPKAAMYAAACLSLAVGRRPSQAFALLDGNAMAPAVQLYLIHNVFDLVHNSECIVEEYYGVAAFINILPLLYCFGDWKSVHQPIQGRGTSSLGATLASTTFNILFNLHRAKEDGDDRVDRSFDIQTFPELKPAVIFIDPRIKSDVLREHPFSWAVVASFEVMVRWANRGVPMRNMRMSTTDTGSEPIGDLVRECTPQMESICEEARSTGQQLFQDFLEGNHPDSEAEAYRSKDFLLSRRMYRLGKWCAYCGEENGRVSQCGGGCLGLARYCCEAHQHKHWPRHKLFCKMQKNA